MEMLSCRDACNWLGIVPVLPDNALGIVNQAVIHSMVREKVMMIDGWKVPRLCCAIVKDRRCHYN